MGDEEVSLIVDCESVGPDSRFGYWQRPFSPVPRYVSVPGDGRNVAGCDIGATYVDGSVRSVDDADAVVVSVSDKDHSATKG